MLMTNRKIMGWLLLLPLSFGAYAQEIKDTKQDTTKQLAIDEVVVTGTRDSESIRNLPLNISIIDHHQMDSRLEPSILPSLTEQIPGLFTTARGIMGYGVSTGGSGGMKMRGIGGSPTTGMLVLIDGHPQYMGLMGHPIADAYQTMMAQRVEVVRGPASMLYGSNAMGGVINILTKTPSQDGVQGATKLAYGSYNSFTSETSSTIKSGKLTAQIVGSYNSSDGHRPNMDFEQYGGYAKVGYEFSNRWKLFGDLSLTHYNASNPGEESKPIIDNDSRITRGMASLSLENNYDKTSGALKLFYNWGHHNINNGYFDGAQPQDYLFDSHDLMVGASAYQSVHLLKRNDITFGVDYQKFGGKADNQYFDGSEKSLADVTEDNVAAYVDIRQGLGDIVTFNVGLRVDEHSKTGTFLIPQLGTSIKTSQTSEIKAIASKGFRNPTIREMYMFATQNPDLNPEELWSYELSWQERLLGGRLSYQAALFYIDGENMIESVQVDGRPKFENTGEIKNWGVELSGRYQVCNSVSLSANYSYLDMEYKVIAAPEHKLYAGVDYIKDKWWVSTGVQHIAGLYTRTGQNSVKEDPFTLWNLRCAYELSDVVRLNVRGENLLNQSYEINYGFPMAGTTVMVGVDFGF